jgi:hypothetical protein
MHVKKPFSKRTTIGIVVLGCAMAALVWGLALGAGMPHTDLLVSRERVGDLGYTRPRASAAIATTGAMQAASAWSFDRGLPKGWARSPGTRVQTRINGITFATSPSNEIQLRSPSERLPSGLYRVLIDGTVLSGGLQVAVETSDRQHCSCATYFDPRSSTPQRPFLPLDFRLNERRTVRIVLGNWTDRNRSSLWRLHLIRVISVPAADQAAARYRDQASPLVPMSGLPVVLKRFHWTFTRRGLAPWLVAQGVHTRPAQSGLVVRTSPDPYGYALTMTLRLDPGRYLLRFDGKILQGGLSIGAIDVKENAWLGEHFYWYRQNGSPGVMAAPFKFLHWGTVELVLGNWAIRATPSKWLLRIVELDQLVCC